MSSKRAPAAAACLPSSGVITTWQSRFVNTLSTSQTGMLFLHPWPQVMWTFGGTWLLVGTLVEVTFLFILDQI